MGKENYDAEDYAEVQEAVGRGFFRVLRKVRRRRAVVNSDRK